MKYIIFTLIAIVLVLVSSNNTIKLVEDIHNEKPITQRIFSNEKIVGNNFCDDGENLFLDNDCSLSFDLITSGQIMYQMWFLRLILIACLFLFITKSKYFPFSVISFITLFAVNSSNGMSFFSNMPQLSSFLFEGNKQFDLLIIIVLIIITFYYLKNET